VPIRKVVIDPDLLTPKDFKRARVALGGRDPWELLRGEQQEDRAVLIAWCLLSRDDPDLTFEQLEEAPFGTFVEPDEAEPDPPTPGPSSNGAAPGGGTAARSKAKRGSSEPDSAAATSSA
jgi:hypothetical protein